MHQAHPLPAAGRRGAGAGGGWARLRRAGAAATAALAAAAAQADPAAASQGAPALQLRVVGGLAHVSQYTRHEEPFWTTRLSALTGGAVVAEIVPFDRAGIRGQDMLRLLQQGVVPFGTALLSLSAGQDPLMALADMPGASPDMAALRRGVAAARPVLAAHLQHKLGLRLLAVYAYPAQVLFCRQAFTGLADLAGRRVRVSSASQSDFIDALGAQPVFTPFAELLPKLRADQLDCAITGTMSGNTIGLHQGTSHLHALPISWGLSLFAANGAAWAALPATLRSTLERELPLLEQAVWADAERETGEGIACNTGAAGCRQGQAGRMVLVQPSAADRQRLRSVLSDTLLPRWAARCGGTCVQAWNQRMAPVVGVRLRSGP